MMLVDTLTIVGVGLIGGSVGLAAKRRGVAKRVIGMGRDPDNLAKARDRGAIDVGTVELADAVRDADLVIFCTPVNRVAEQLLEASAWCKLGAVLTDAGSTKQSIVCDIEAKLPAHVGFVGGHPLAGSEKKGVEHAEAELFSGRCAVLTPTPATPRHAFELVQAFWKGLGARIVEMTPGDHDRALAMTSHLPHLLAASLAGVLDPRWQALTATGFRDTTRVASGDAEVWTPIFRHNRIALMSALSLLESQLQRFRSALEQDDPKQIDQLLTQGKKVRDALGS